MSNWECAKAAMNWLYQLPPNAHPLDYLEKLKEHLQEKGHDLTRLIAPVHLASNEALIARLEKETAALSTSDLQTWVHLDDINTGGNFDEDLKEFVERGQLPWSLRAHKNDPRKLREVVRALPSQR